MISDEEHIKLPANLDLAAAVPLRTLFLDAIVGPVQLRVDAADVASITTPCLQILLSAGRTAEAAGGSLSFANVPTVMRVAFGELGLDDEFDRWSEAS